MALLPRMLTLLIGAALLMTGGCSDAPAQTPPGDGLTGHLVITGSSTCAPLVSEVALRFEAAHPDVRIDVQTGGSSRGIRDVRQASADIGMVSRELNADESAALDSTFLARDRIAFIVHAENPVGVLSQTHLREIYRGDASNWRDVGGADAPIVVSNRAEGRSELTLVSAFLNLSPTEIDADVIDGETQQSIKTVGGNVNAITYTSEGAARHAIEQGAPLQLVKISTSEQINDGSLWRPLLLIRTRDTNELAEAFIEFAISRDHDDLIESFAYVPPAPAQQ